MKYRTSIDLLVALMIGAIAIFFIMGHALH